MSSVLLRLGKWEGNNYETLPPLLFKRSLEGMRIYVSKYLFNMLNKYTHSMLYYFFPNVTLIIVETDIPSRNYQLSVK